MNLPQLAVNILKVPYFMKARCLPDIACKADYLGVSNQNSLDD